MKDGDDVVLRTIEVDGRENRGNANDLFRSAGCFTITEWDSQHALLHYPSSLSNEGGNHPQEVQIAESTLSLARELAQTLIIWRSGIQ